MVARILAAMGVGGPSAVVLFRSSLPSCDTVDQSGHRSQNDKVPGGNPLHQREMQSPSMNTDPKARDLFIVDNSISGWTGLRYLEEWAGIAKGFDVATGYFEIGSLLALDGKWQGKRPSTTSPAG
jgi:hypothetical protein